MSSELVPIPRRDLSRAGMETLPAAIGRAGEAAAWRFIEFFAATIRNRNTRYAYAEAVSQFFAWCEKHRVYTLEQVKPIVIASYIENHPGAAPTVKQTFGSDQDALRFPGDRANRTDEPSGLGPRSEACGPSREDAGPHSRPGEDAP